MDSILRPKGHVNLKILYADGRTEILDFPNIVLKTGREALAASLADQFGGTYDFFISRMLFGDGGTVQGVPKIVNANRNGLFGLQRADKAVISSIDPKIRSQVVFTAVLDFQDANGFNLNEMALQMNTGDLYSMATFPDLGKTNQMSLTWSWRISFI